MRSRPDEYLIRLNVGGRQRQILWHSDEALEVDLPHGWKIEKKAKRIHFYDQFDKSTRDKYFIEDDGFNTLKSQSLNLPAPKGPRAGRPLSINLVKLKAPRPVYTGNPTLEALHTSAPRQLCAFYGQRYFLIHYRPVKTATNIANSGRNIFTYKKTEQGYAIAALTEGVQITIGGKRADLPEGRYGVLPEVDFFRSTISQGVHWWRIRMVPTPDGQPPLDTDETEIDIRESVRLQYSAVGFLSVFAAMLAALFVFTKLYPPQVKLPHVEVTIKAPKVFPAFKEAKVIPPPPPPKKPEVKKEEPKKIAKAEPKPTPPVKVAQAKPKKHPAKKVAAKKAIEKPIAKAPPPPPEPKPMPVAPPEPVKVVKDPGPTPAQLLAAKKAQEQAAQQTQALNSLNFLSTSKNRPAVEDTNYKSKTGKFAESAKAGGLSSTSNVLDKMASGAPGDANIKTKSSRDVASNIEFKNNKGLNDVQGKVSLGELSAKNGDPGAALSGGKGIEFSGPGSLSEAQVEKALAKFLAKFQYCYEKALLSDSSLAGNVVMSWTISEAGRSTAARVVNSQMKSKDLESCIVKVLAQVPFPKPKGGTVSVKKTFTFSSSAL